MGWDGLGRGTIKKMEGRGEEGKGGQGRRGEEGKDVLLRIISHPPMNSPLT